MRDLRGLVCALFCAGVMGNCLAQYPPVMKTVVPSDMVLVQGGSLTNIGNGAITVDSFYIGKYEITWTEWQTVRDWAATNGFDIGSSGAGNGPDHPVELVNWYDCVKWCNARSEKEDRTPVYTVGASIYKRGQTNDVAVNLAATGYRLPTENEWEFAARGGTQSQGYVYSGGTDLNTVAWYSGNRSPPGTKAVGTKVANELGLYDMSGNVWEWCFDWYRGLTEPNLGRVCRGGSWYFDAEYGRTGFRFFIFPIIHNYAVGLRVVLPYGQHGTNTIKIVPKRET